MTREDLPVERATWSTDDGHLGGIDRGFGWLSGEETPAIARSQEAVGRSAGSPSFGTGDPGLSRRTE